MLSKGNAREQKSSATVSDSSLRSSAAPNLHPSAAPSLRGRKRGLPTVYTEQQKLLLESSLSAHRTDKWRLLKPLPPYSTPDLIHARCPYSQSLSERMPRTAPRQIGFRS